MILAYGILCLFGSAAEGILLIYRAGIQAIDVTINRSKLHYMKDKHTLGSIQHLNASAGDYFSWLMIRYLAQMVKHRSRCLHE